MSYCKIYGLLGREPVYATTPVMQNSRSILLPLPSVNLNTFARILVKRHVREDEKRGARGEEERRAR